MNSVQLPIEEMTPSIRLIFALEEKKPDWKQIAIAWLTFLSMVVRRFPVGLVTILNERIASTNKEWTSRSFVFLVHQSIKEKFRTLPRVRNLLSIMYLIVMKGERINLSLLNRACRKKTRFPKQYEWLIHFLFSSKMWSIRLVDAFLVNQLFIDLILFNITEVGWHN